MQTERDETGGRGQGGRERAETTGERERAETGEVDPYEEPAPAFARPARRGARDMVMSLVVLLGVIVLFVTIFRLRGGEDPVVIDPSAVLDQAEAAGAFPVGRPQGLTDGWRPVSAVFRREDGGAVLRVGYLTPTGGGVQIIESDQPVEELLRRELGDQVRPVGTAEVAGQPWQSYEVRGDERALVRTDAERTLIVIGRAGLDELRTLAAAIV